MRRITALGTGVGLGHGPTTRKPGSGPKPKNRVPLSPSLRRAVADVHARQVFLEHIAPHLGRASFTQLADYLTAERVPPVRGRSWSGQVVYDLVRRARQTAKSGDGY